jgi:hypothetical protein
VGRFFSVLSVILWASLAQAQPIPGLDELALHQFPKAANASNPRGWVLAAFTNTFGDSLPDIEKEIQLHNPAAVIGRLHWDDRHGCDAKKFDEIAKEAARFNVVAKRHPERPFIATGWTENECDQGKAALLRAMVLAKCPECDGYSQSVNCNTGAFLYDDPQRTFNEVHGVCDRVPAKGKIIYSFDGKPAVDLDFKAILKRWMRATYFLIWDCRFNGRWECNDKTPRPQRKGWADSPLIKSLFYLWNEKGAVGKFASLWLWKSNSENKGTGDWRAEKPVAILPVSADAISIVAVDDAVIATCSGRDAAGKIYSPMTTSPWSSRNKGYRFYCKEMGFELAEKARKHGSALVRIRAKKTLSPQFNPAFRHDTFRD